MPQVFHKSFNTVSRLTMGIVLLLVVGTLSLLGAIDRSDYKTRIGEAIVQPVPFSHAHHVGEEGFDCRFCHTVVEKSPFAGLPSTEVCMHCHKQLWSDSPMLEPVRESYRTGMPIRWKRVHDLPDYAYFHHGAHLAAGIGCSECHGRVDRMPLMWKVATLKMEWCLDCHRDPASRIRPKEHVFDMAWDPDSIGEERRRELVQEYQIPTYRMKDCTVCHR